MGEERELCRGGGAGTVKGPGPREAGGSLSQRKADSLCFALDLGAGGGEAWGGHSPLPFPFVLILELSTGVYRFYFFPRALQRTPVSYLDAPTLLCFSGMYFHLKTTLNGALFLSCFKN
uniref:Uncharacterized protein n=1 Tax=Pongo abelii TaxID=9601 RepID=A0A8I5U0B1_PONAB